jgi:hypothetical protein
MKNEIKALIGAGVLSLAFIGGVALAPSLVSSVAAQTGPSTDQTTDQHGPGHDPFTVAAQYIGITVDQLRTEMGTTKSLADVAIAHGKTRDGLIAALVAAETANIQQRVGDLVDHKGAPQRPGDHHGFGPGSPGFAGVRFDFFQAASTYLGISTQDLMTKLKSGQNLGQIAGATQGKSRDGLIAALVQAETAQIDQAVKDNKLTADQATKLKTDLTTRITSFVDGKFPPMGPVGPGGRPGFGPRGPQPSPTASPKA